MFTRILTLLKESSSWAGLAGVFGGMALFGFNEGQWNEIFAALMAVAGAVAMVMRDTGDMPDE